MVHSIARSLSCYYKNSLLLEWKAKKSLVHRPWIQFVVLFTTEIKKRQRDDSEVEKPT